jgi:hypothetical protein
MQHFIVTTTIDITPTGVRRKTDDTDWFIKRNQQRNYDTLLQVISLRCQPLDVDVNTIDLTRFDEDMKKHWILTFSTDRQDVLGYNGHLFLEDIHGVPIVPNLTETDPSFPPQFMSRGNFKNIDITIVNNISK